MMNNKQYRLAFIVQSKSSLYPDGLFRVLLYCDKKSESQKDGNLKNRTPEQAYKIIIDWSNEQALENGFTFVPPTLRSLLDRIDELEINPAQRGGARGVVKPNRVGIIVSGSSKSYPDGIFRGIVKIDGKTVTQKDGNLMHFSPSEALRIVNEWAQIQAEQRNLPFAPMPLDEATELLIQKKANPHGLSKPAEPGAKFGIELPHNVLDSKTKFRKAVRDAYRALGYDRVKETLDDGLLILLDTSEEDRAAQAVENSANIAMARALYKIQQDTGLSMFDKISDPAVQIEYQRLVVQAKEAG